MTKLTKKKKLLMEILNPENTYSLEEAINIFQQVKSSKFDESIDIALRLGVDPGKSDQNVRGAITLPHSLGKKVTVAVFADGDQAKEASDAGADFVGMEDLSEKFKKEEIDVDVVISSQAAMKIVGQLGQVLGPKGLMPNPKTERLLKRLVRQLTMLNQAKLGLEQIKMEYYMDVLEKFHFHPIKFKKMQRRC